MCDTYIFQIIILLQLLFCEGTIRIDGKANFNNNLSKTPSF
jgi:hypothetical protein